MLTHLVREISKVLMFIVTWSIPLLVSYMTEDSKFLFLFIGSFFVTLMYFNHYEELERITLYGNAKDKKTN